MFNLLEKKRWFAITLTILIAIEIYHISSLSGTSTGGGNPWIARIYHLVVFFLFAFFILASIKGIKKLTTKTYISALIISIIYAILDEFHQIFVPGRDGSIRDFMTDTIGIFFAVLIYFYISKKSKQST